MNALHALLAQDEGLGIVEFLKTEGLAFAYNAAIALVIFFVGRWAAKIATSTSEKMMRRGSVDETLTKFLGNIVYALLLVIVILAALTQLGVPVTSAAAILAAAGFAVGMALKDSLGNFAAGVMIILFRPFSVGHFVEVAGTSGTVDEIHIFSTVLHTGDNVRIIIPNGTIINDPIKNFSAQHTRRIDLVVGCGYGDNLKEVKSFLTELVADEERILDDPEPLVAVDELGDSSVNFVVRTWVKADDYWPTRRDMIERVKLGFDERGFNIPFPTRDVHVHNVA